MPYGTHSLPRGRKSPLRRGLACPRHGPTSSLPNRAGHGSSPGVTGLATEPNPLPPSSPSFSRRRTSPVACSVARSSGVVAGKQIAEIESRIVVKKDAGQALPSWVSRQRQTSSCSATVIGDSQYNPLARFIGGPGDTGAAQVGRPPRRRVRSARLQSMLKAVPAALKLQRCPWPGSTPYRRAA